MPDSFTETFAAGLAGYSNRPCLEFEERWLIGNEVTGYADGIAHKLRAAGVPEDAPVGVVVGNRLPHAAAIVGLLAAGRWVSMIYSFQSPDVIARDVEQLGLAAVVADRENWTAPVIAAAARSGSAGVAKLAARRPTVELVGGRPGPRRRHPSDTPQSDGAAGLHVLTSGTTGPPKRQAINAARIGAHCVQRDRWTGVAG